MPRIHVFGTKPSDCVYRMRCTCGCVADFASHEVHSDQRERDSWVHCPTCGAAHSLRATSVARVRADTPLNGG